MDIKLAIKAEVLRAIDEGSARDESPRKYLGFSEIGKDDRYLWLKFRHCLKMVDEDDDGILDENYSRISRVFEVGHEYEKKINGWLEDGGLLVGNDQAEISLLDGHFKGHTDGDLMVDGVLPMTEKKSANRASSNRFIKCDTVREWNEVYWVQAQSYAGHFKYRHIVFIVICKDTQRVSVKVEDVDPWVYDSSCYKAEQIIFNTDKLPYSTWSGPEWYESKFIGDYNSNIYWGKTVPKPGCRNCRHSCPTVDGEWWCGEYERTVDIARQLKNDCGLHQFLPCLLETPLAGTVVENVQKDDQDIVNKKLSSVTIYNSLQAAAIENGNMEVFDKNTVINKSMAEAFDPKLIPGD